jgi:hypothetical protein
VWHAYRQALSSHWLCAVPRAFGACRFGRWPAGAATPAHAACAACVLTSYTSDPLGPIIDYGEFVGGNVAGCIELEAPRELACAKAVQALTGCEIAACEANCPVSNETSLMGREACADVARRELLRQGEAVPHLGRMT